MAETRQLILDTSEKLFARHGYDATSVRTIADGAGVNQAMISYYFGSKEGLLKSIIDRYSAHLIAVIRKADISGLAPLARLKSIFRVYVDFSFVHPEPIIIAQRELGVNNRPLLQDLIYHNYLEVKQLLFGIIREGQETGGIREVDLSLFMFTIGAMTENLIKEVHSMELISQDPSAFGLSGLDDAGFRERFFSMVWEIIETYLTRDVHAPDEFSDKRLADASLTPAPLPVRRGEKKIRTG